MEIHLIRHTPVNVASGICYGQSDVDLQDNYLKDFEQIHPVQNFDVVISSPLQRCTKLAGYLSSSYIEDKRIMEVNFGDWELRAWNEIPADELNPWYENYLNIAPPNGERLTDMEHRVLDFYKNLEEKYSGQKILVITHAGVIRILLKYILEIPADKMFSFDIEYGKQTIIRHDKSLKIISAINI